MITVCLHIPFDVNPAFTNLPEHVRRVGPFSKWNESRNYEYDALNRDEADALIERYKSDPALGVRAHIKGDV